MSFLQPLLLYALPLALLPIIIHLIHLHRRRTVSWAAMMFLLAAQQMNRGFSRLRRWLILAFRVLAVAALIMMAGRPLAGGWLGLTGGVPDTVLILLDRSASMEQQNPATGLTKREAGLTKLADGVEEAYGGRTRLVLIDNASEEPQLVERVDALADLPSSWATDTTADIPTLVQNALDYITDNQTGRTDVWLLSDLRQTDWDAAGGRWEALRQAFAELQGVRFHLLCYPQESPENLSVTVERVERRESSEKAELLLDLRIARNEIEPAPMDLPLRFVVNGTASTFKTELRDNTLTLQAHAIPIDKSVKRGWGRVELPADTLTADNAWHFVFDEPPVLKSVIVTDDPLAMAPVRAALEAPSDPTRKYTAAILSPDRAAEIEWDDTALIIWQAPLPSARDAIVARQLETHVAAGRTLIFLPPEVADDAALFGQAWADWVVPPGSEPDLISWWRNDAGLLANTRNGTALPVGEIEVLRRRPILPAEQSIPPVPLARMDNNEPLLIRATPEGSAQQGAAWFLGTLPGTDSSTLASDGVVFYALSHRALGRGGASLGTARQRPAGLGALGDEDSAGRWKPVENVRTIASGSGDGDAELASSELLPLRAGILEAGDGEELLALNRPLREDLPRVLNTSAVDELFTGLDYRILEDTLDRDDSLTSEIWRTFLLLMAAALLLEAILSMPPKRSLHVGAESSSAREAARETAAMTGAAGETRDAA